MEQPQEYISVMRLSVSYSRIRPRILGSALKTVWSLLVSRDNWQGEFAVSLFGAVGWGLVNLLTAAENSAVPQYRVLDMLFPDWFWQFWLIGFGLMQLVGLRYELPWPRAVASGSITFAFVCIFQSVLISQMNGAAVAASGVVLYLVCIFIELCAMIYQIGNIVRYKEYPRWIGRRLGSG